MKNQEDKFEKFLFQQVIGYQNRDPKFFTQVWIYIIRLYSGKILVRYGTNKEGNLEKYPHIDQHQTMPFRKRIELYLAKYLKKASR